MEFKVGAGSTELNDEAIRLPQLNGLNSIEGAELKVLTHSEPDANPVVFSPFPYLCFP